MIPSPHRSSGCLAAPVSPIARAALLCLVLSGPALAQQAAPLPEPEPAESAPAAGAEAARPAAAQRLDKVQLNGSRRASLSTRLPLSRRETPQSLTSVGAQRLEDEQLLSVDDVLRQVTGVNVSHYDTQRPLYFARGFQITDFQVDGMPSYSGSTNQEYDTALYERIDIVRGANGLLSGAGLPSATIHLQRKRAQRDFAAAAALTVGAWNLRRLQGDLNVPLSEDGRLRARFVAALQKRDSHLDRYQEDKAAWMAVLEAEPQAGTVLTLGVQNQDNRPTGSTWGTIPRFAADGSLARLPVSTNFAPRWTRWSRESGTLFLNAEQRLGEDWALKAAYNHTRGEVVSRRAYASGFPDPRTGQGVYLLAGVSDGEDRRDAADLYLSGRFSWLGRRHELVLGASSQRLRALSPTLSAVGKWRYDIPDLARWDGNAPEPEVTRTGARRVTVTQQSGLYATARWRLTEPLALITGLRVSHWKTWTDAWNAQGGYSGRSAAYRVGDELTPYLGLVHELGRGHSVYASITDIFKPQNYRDRDNRPLAPVRGKNLELGIKGELDNGLAWSAAAFRTRQNGLGVRDSSVPEGSLPDGSSAFIGVDGTESRGLELELFGEPLPGLSLQGGYTYLHTRRQATDLIWTNLPDHYLQVSGRYRFGGALQGLSLGASLNWQSAVEGFNIPHPLLGTTTVRQPAYALLGLSAGWRFNERYSLTLSARNVLDQRYWANLDYPNYGEPRNWLLSLHARL
ncbi:TonB-dependent siderophore receptor [Pelomonas sp. CA6]|uniref:TonB-dependent siderophore receptor n=1 Tax=Pelomonas sp. CA6 TaxID=2907999 RepID=UPI001F4C153B|nr:TonB-dependent siderophore receptor [Pelomonas sp. CA6]MCH7343386.1 TonB-dependent siderophore receptor [Pelomonas sp. CA6]